MPWTSLPFNSGNPTPAQTSDKPQKEVTQEIQAIIRQITASVTFLPLLNEPCCFDLLVYADKQATVPVTWEDSDPCFIANSEQVKLRSFDTKVSNHCDKVMMVLIWFTAGIPWCALITSAYQHSI